MKVSNGNLELCFYSVTQSSADLLQSYLKYRDLRWHFKDMLLYQIVVSIQSGRNKCSLPQTLLLINVLIKISRKFSMKMIFSGYLVVVQLLKANLKR